MTITDTKEIIEVLYGNIFLLPENIFIRTHELGLRNISIITAYGPKYKDKYTSSKFCKPLGIRPEHGFVVYLDDNQTTKTYSNYYPNSILIVDEVGVYIVDSIQIIATHEQWEEWGIKISSREQTFFPVDPKTGGSCVILFSKYGFQSQREIKKAQEHMYYLVKYQDKIRKALMI